MKVLFVTHHYLSGFGGGTFASKAFINAFGDVCEDVTLLYPVRDGEGNNGINRLVKQIPVSYNIPKWRKLLRLCMGKTHRYYDAFKKIMGEQHFDLVVFDNSCVSFGLIDIAHRHHAKVITIHHNFEYEYRRDSSDQILRPVTLFWIKRYEQESLLKSDLNLTLTPDDKKLFIQNYHADGNKIDVLGCFEYESKKNEYRNSSSPHSFVITGNLSAKQTEDSLLPWLHIYYPLLKEKIPDVKLTLAGKHPSDKIKDICTKLKLRLIDTPPNMDCILEESRYYICPTSLGGGIKLRVMDGLSHGLPVLTHRVSARGYQEFEGRYLFSFDDEDSFCHAVDKILALQYNNTDIITFYRKTFSYDAGVNRLRSILDKHKNMLCPIEK